MADWNKPFFDDRRTKATFALFQELGCLRNVGPGKDVTRLDEEKMMARALDCLAAVCEAQRVRVALGKPLQLREDGDALTSEQQAARNEVFQAAMNTVAKGLTHDGSERDDLDCFTNHLLRAFPDSGKLTDGRGWLPMHWAIVSDEDTESNVTEADVLFMYEMDPMALRTHHLVAVTDAESSAGKLGYTPAHMLCGLEMTEKNMSLVRQLSVFHSRAFTTTLSNIVAAKKTCSALHVACMNPRRTEALLRLLVQLDPSQTKSFSSCHGPLRLLSQTKSFVSQGSPLGLLCTHSDELDERQFDCLAEADSSVEVVFDAIIRCIERKSTFTNRVQTVAKLLEVNPMAAQHKCEKGRNLAHWACRHSDTIGVIDCVEILKLLLARHKDALKEADNRGKLPAQIAAESGSVQEMDFVLGEYPGAAAVVDRGFANLLHIAAGESGEHQVAKARLLCTRYPAMMLQRDADGRTPLLQSCLNSDWAMTRLLCEAGGREVAAAAVAHPTSSIDPDNGCLPLHWLISSLVFFLNEWPHAEAADVFRLLLRLYPEAAGIEGGVGSDKRTAYQMAVERHLPTYFHRLLLRAAPDLDPAELRRLNWDERRLAMFVAFAAVSKSRLLLVQLRVANKDLVKYVVSFL